MDMYKAIGERVRFLRIQNKLPQEQLAEQAGISLSFLGHIERGTRKLSVETFYKLIIALNCTPDDLIGLHTQIRQGRKPSTLLAALAEELRQEGR